MKFELVVQCGTVCLVWFFVSKLVVAIDLSCVLC